MSCRADFLVLVVGRSRGHVLTPSATHSVNHIIVILMHNLEGVDGNKTMEQPGSERQLEAATSALYTVVLVESENVLLTLIEL